MTRRIEKQNEIANIRLADQKITFPNKRTGKTIIHSLPSDEEINATIEKAKHEAIQNATKLGMYTVNNIDEYTFQCNENISNLEENDEDYWNEDVGEDETEEDFFDTEKIAENSPYIVVNDENGIKKKIRKSTYVWMLAEPSEKISNDRLRRVQTRAD